MRARRSQNTLNTRHTHRVPIRRVHEAWNEGRVELRAESTDMMPADIFTKSVEPSAHFGYLRDVIMGINPTLYLSVGVKELLFTGDTDQGNKLLTQSISQGHAVRSRASGPDGLPIT